MLLHPRGAVALVHLAFGYLGTPQARLGLLVVPALILGLLAVLDIWRPKLDADYLRRWADELGVGEEVEELFRRPEA